MRAYDFVKQAFDLLVSVCLIILLSPILILIAIVIKLDSSGPVLFRQKRIGKNGRDFFILKFRTMRTDTPKDLPTHMFQDAGSYITKSGSFLRKSSLDELPQIFNILKGEMTFVGPRPALWNQYDLIEARAAQKFRLGVDANSIRPGITGWAQVNGRDELPIEIKADFDGYYAAHYSLPFDIKIVLMTVFSVLTRKGISEGGPKA